jgi:anaerobic glycerol-3-phosphate dehydrogenase
MIDTPNTLRRFIIATCNAIDVARCIDDREEREQALHSLRLNAMNLARVFLPTLTPNDRTKIVRALGNML